MGLPVNSRKISYRPLRPGDEQAVHDVALESWKATYGWLTQEFMEERVGASYSADELRAAMRRTDEGQASFQVATDGERVVGFAYVDDRGEGWELVRLYVLPAYVGSGIGSKLLARGEAFLREKGAETYFCYVHRDNERALRFYRSRGFVHTPEGDHPTIPLMRMAKRL